MHQRRDWRSALLLLAAGSFLMTSCKKEIDSITPQSSTTTSTTSTSDQEVNKWIIDNLKIYYYWNDKLPANPNNTQKPADFFKSLLYSYDATVRPDGDRFSWIQESADELKASLSGESKTTGMEYQLYRPAGTDDIYGKVLYTHPGSPAALAGIKRGDIFYKVNGQKLVTANYSQLLAGDGSTFTYGFAKLQDGKIVTTDETKTVTPVVLQQNPILMDTVYTIAGKTIGYFVYNQFVPGPNGSSVPTYDNQLDAIFGKFKAKGVNELVIDFRYNPGGYVSSATNLASLIGRGVDQSKVFARKEWNSTLTPELEKQYGKSFFYDYFKTKANNIGGNLNRVYVLTTRRTASASELVINGLRPYMTVTTIGATTTGKNVGSITISDDTKKIKWGMQPIVSKSFNSLGQSDYTAGFIPAVKIDELLTQDWKQFGDISEVMLNEAIYQITGGRTARRPAPPQESTTIISSSIEQKAGGSNMFFEAPALRVNQ
ncbi:hypothetical protein GCM10023187_37630 [Nibrella viscosa]|uniref:Tail specific protease domain-containing protein n=1 Tax=Nibrella viscosa TaxID=1084524 RepID=A0ABP8KNB8_9BACT